ncbi:hypothetical protein ACOBR2_14735 [Telmatobacter bradus]|uniref:hypothetical protein n=1 Tax=Telmatobacter bradus TaxID=474953 RepID=UPI003B42A890
MSETTLYSIVAAPDGHGTRLGWVSSTTGITYCGICLRSSLKPCVGELCESCGACVVGVFDPAAGTQAIRRAWSRVSAPPAPLNQLPEPVKDQYGTH